MIEKATGPQEDGVASAAVEGLASWSAWVDLNEAVTVAPMTPGVYIARERSGPVVYVGMAGERPGSRGVPQGLRGRLRVYTTGKAAVSGLGEAALDRAVADPVWLGERLPEVEQGRPRRVLDWAQLALRRADLELRWAITVDRAAARELEEAVLDVLVGAGLWNRRGARRRPRRGELGELVRGGRPPDGVE